MVLKLILPCLLIILILVMYHYFSHVILEKEKRLLAYLGYWDTKKRNIYCFFE